jgi:HPt (histidine-containing phosphotransfer) domain-containing protein
VVSAMRVAHNLRTSASTLGMMALGEIALRLELVCRDGDIDTYDVSALLCELSKALAPVLVSLQSLRPGVPSGATAPAPAAAAAPTSATPPARENPRPPTLSDESPSD